MESGLLRRSAPSNLLDGDDVLLSLVAVPLTLIIVGTGGAE